MNKEKSYEQQMIEYYKQLENILSKKEKQSQKNKK
jgi:hypothetical protein